MTAGGKQEWFHRDVPKNPVLPEEEHRMTDCRSTVSDFTVGEPQFNKVLKAILGLCLYFEPDIISSANEVKI